MESLPLELQEVICNALSDSPIDLIAMQATCKWLHARTFWTKYYRSAALKIVPDLVLSKDHKLNWKKILLAILKQQKEGWYKNEPNQELCIKLTNLIGIMDRNSRHRDKEFENNITKWHLFRPTLLQQILDELPSIDFGFTYGNITKKRIANRGKGTLLTHLCQFVDPNNDEFARKLLDELLSRGADVNLPNLVISRSSSMVEIDWPIVAAIQRKWKYGVEKLLKVDNLALDVVSTAPSERYLSPLRAVFHSTYIEESTYLLKLLLAHLDPNEPTTRGRALLSPTRSLKNKNFEENVTVLHVNFYRSDPPPINALKMLLDRGANFNVQTVPSKYTPMHVLLFHANSYGKDEELFRLVKFLVEECKVDLTLETTSGMNAIHFAMNSVKAVPKLAPILEYLKQRCPQAGSVPKPWSVCRLCGHLFKLLENHSKACKTHPLIDHGDNYFDSPTHPCCNTAFGSEGCTEGWHLE